MTTDERPDDRDKREPAPLSGLFHYVPVVVVNGVAMTPEFYAAHTRSAVDPNNLFWVDLYRRDDGLRERNT